jgi:hypothetical protein
MSKSHHGPNENREEVAKRRYAVRRHWLDGIKIAAGCKDCGLDGPPEALTFDHVTGEKKFDIGPSWNQGRLAIEEEIAKCEIVCANCHNIRTKRRGKDGPEFESFPSIRRLSREVVITEKIDGTNATVWVDGEGQVWAGSRNRWITPQDDNAGFAKWVEAHQDEFSALGPCTLRGEWWGQGIQRGYGLKEKRFSLFNVARYETDRPSCCDVVPVLYRGIFDTNEINEVMKKLELFGSVAAPGFLKPEGIVVFHTAASVLFKKTLDGDGHKGAKAE